MIPTGATISGKDLAYGTDAIVTPTAAFPQDFYEQLVGTKASDGSQVPLYVTSPSKTAAVMDAAPQWAFMPQTPTGSFANLGAFDSSVAQLLNGASIGGSVPYDNLQTVVFDGANDYVDSGWRTWTNVWNNPYCATSKNGWGDAGTTGNTIYVTALPTTIGLPEGITTGVKIEGSGGADGGQYITIPVVAGGTYTLSYYMYRVDTNSQKFRTVIYDGDSTTVLLNTTTEPNQTPGEWKRFSFTYTANITGTSKVRIDTASGAGTGVAYVTACMVEKSATLNPYGPLPKHVASGAAIFQGTAHESICDIGPFARKGLRTFIWAQNRTNESTIDIVLGGGGGGNTIVLRANAGGTDGEWIPNAASGGTTAGTGAYPAGVNWMTMTYNDVTKATRIYKNGVAVSAEKTTLNSFPEPIGQNLVIGNNVSLSNGWLGRIAAVAIVPRYLTATEVENINSGVGS